MELNKIYNIDVLDGLRQLEDKSIDLIITSPPYNKAGFNGKNGKRRKGDVWNHTINYGGDVNNDCMDEEEYENWQVEILNECFRVLKDDGSMFYNHKLRVKNNTASFPLDWISRSKFIFRQLIIWDRGSSPNIDKCRYLPVSEYIFWLIKRPKNPRFRKDDNTMYKTEVWRFGPDMKNKHPAPFPMKLPDNIIPNVAQGERIVVLDPFMGSGTVAKSAIKWGCDYIGFEKLKEYCDMTNENIENFKKELEMEKNKEKASE